MKMKMAGAVLSLEDNQEGGQCVYWSWKWLMTADSRAHSGKKQIVR
jgi:hypothetical protein